MPTQPAFMCMHNWSDTRGEGGKHWTYSARVEVGECTSFCKARVSGHRRRLTAHRSRCDSWIRMPDLRSLMICFPITVISLCQLFVCRHFNVRLLGERERENKVEVITASLTLCYVTTEWHFFFKLKIGFKTKLSVFLWTVCSGFFRTVW